LKKQIQNIILIFTIRIADGHKMTKFSFTKEKKDELLKELNNKKAKGCVVG
jgi:hypothetical protein